MPEWKSKAGACDKQPIAIVATILLSAKVVKNREGEVETISYKTSSKQLWSFMVSIVVVDRVERRTMIIDITDPHVGNLASKVKILDTTPPLYQNIRPENLHLGDMLTDPPLTKSLGFAIGKRFDKTLEDARLNQEYMYRYHEMLKASQESFENFASRDERKLRSVIGNHNFEVMREAGVLDRRRNAPRFHSPVGSRRARTQALRRQKLNSQSLRSHLQHSRQTTTDSSE